MINNGPGQMTIKYFTEHIDISDDFFVCLFILLMSIVLEFTLDELVG